MTFGPSSSATLLATGKRASASITLTGSGTTTFVTHTEAAWGDQSAPAGSLLIAHFDDVYLNSVEVGVPGPSGFSMRFFDSLAVLDYLPSVGPPGPLGSDLIDPTSSSSGLFGGNVLALQLNVDFADAGLLGGSVGLRFGDVRLCGLDPVVTYLEGLTVREVLGVANAALGQGLSPAIIDDVNDITRELNRSFESGDPSAFAQAHLVVGACP
jgi:hypothetical protein